MRKLLLLIFVLCSASAVYATDTFTVSFAAGNQVYAMQIDEFGNVTQSPVSVASNGNGCSTKTALVDNGGVVWLYYKNDINHLALVRLDKSTLAPISRVRFANVLETNVGGFLSATETPWFLAAGLPVEITKALPLDTTNGKLKGKTWRLSPRTEGSLFNAGVAPDGGAVWAIASDATNHTTVYVQGLGANGKPDKRIEGYATREEFQSGDLTNVLSDNRRFLIYRRFTGPFDDTNTTSQLYLQPINASTLAKDGGRTLIDNIIYNCITGSVAVEAQGRFVVYPRHDFSCGTDLLAFQALDANGNPSGSRIQLTTCASGLAVSGVDVIQN